MTLNSRLFRLALIFATVVSSSHASSQQIRRSESSSADSSNETTATSLAISVTSFVAGSASSASAYSNLRESRMRDRLRTETVFRSVGLPDDVGIIDDILRGTAPGDVVRLEYTVNQPGPLKIAIAELKQSLVVWEQRVQELKATGEALQARIAAIPQTRQNVRQIAALQNEIENLAVVFADAKSRLFAIQQSYSHAAPILTSYNRLGSMFGQKGRLIHITRDILVDPKTAETLETALKKYNSIYSSSRGGSFSNIRVSRTQVPNESLAARSLMRARGGFLAAGVMAALIAEELVVGYLGRSFEESIRAEPGPEPRTVPAATGSNP